MGEPPKGSSTDPTISLATTVRDDLCFRLAGMLSLVAAAMVVASTAMPWVAGSNGGGTSGYEVGPGYFGPALLGAASALVFASGLSFFPLLRPNVLMPFVPSLLVGLLVADQRTGALVSHPRVGFVVCLLGVGFGLVASIVLIPTEHAAPRN